MSKYTKHHGCSSILPKQILWIVEDCIYEEQQRPLKLLSAISYSQFQLMLDSKFVDFGM